MARKQTPGREHLAVAKDAGFKRLSFISTLAGTLTGYGSFAIFAAIIGAIYSAADINTDFSTNNWAGEEAASGLATALSLFLAYLFGGYVAGRMARRAGALHGIAVLVLSLVIGAVVGGLVSAIGDNADIDRNLRSIGVPTTFDDWGDVGIATAIVSLVLMAAGAILGGMLGERWHTKLAKRAADPNYGPEADARDRYERSESERDQHIERDELVRRDHEVLNRDSEEEQRRRRIEQEERETRVRQEQAREMHERQEQAARREREMQQSQPRAEVLDVRDTTVQNTGAHSERKDEPRYTAEEWAEMQRQQSGRGGS